MVKRTAEKAPKQEPELVIPVDEFNRDKLGEVVAKQISGFIGRKARRFGMPLHDTDTLNEATKCFDNYFREVSEEHSGPVIRSVICSVRLRLHRFDKSHGIDLVGVDIEPRDESAEDMSVTGVDLQVPTLEVVGPRFDSRPYVLDTVGMATKVSNGAHQIHVLSEGLRARSFAIGEPIPERDSMVLKY